jgi:hypothetical protein
MRRHASSLMLAGLLGALALSGCGSRGYAAPLGKTAHATLTATGSSQPAGQAVLTPLYATHIAPYYQGKLIPWKDPATPVQLRENACDGKVLAALSSNAPGPAGVSPATAEAADGGVNVALPQTDSVYLVVLENTDPRAKVIACGYPLSARRQYVRLVPPDKNNDAIALGTALMEELVATRVAISLPGQTTFDWSVRTGGCTGPEVARGHQPAAEPAPVVFAAPEASGWWVSAQMGTSTVCGKAST